MSRGSVILFSIQGYIPIPKSQSAGRIKSNADAFGFQLAKEEVAHLDSLNEGLCYFLSVDSIRLDAHAI
jgi:diketogulonate reductase-like aldo/keto reductase